MLYKNVSNSTLAGVIKDVDTKTGTVTGYFSIFGNVDSDGDIIMPGAFKRSLANNYNRVKHLNQHRPYEPLSSTKSGNLSVKEDNQGLFFESKITPTSYGKDVILLYQDGVLDEHSIGYEVKNSRKSQTMKTDGGNYATELLEVKLWEGSTVTWGANSQAGTSSVKSLTKDECIVKMNDVLKALKNGKYEHEEIHDMLELYFKQLETQIQDLSSTQPAAPVDDTALDPQVKDTDLLLFSASVETTLLKLKTL